MAKEVSVDILSINAEGSGVGVVEGRPISIPGAFPGEKVTVQVKRKKGDDGYQGELRSIEVPLSDRIPPQESHFFSSCPWQVIPYEREVEYKQTMYRDMFAEYSSFGLNVCKADTRFGYRTKMEYCVTDREVPLSLAFHKRGGGAFRIPAPYGSIMADKLMNAVATTIIERMRLAGYTSRMIKSIIVRGSKSKHEVFAMVYIKDEEYIPFSCDDIPHLSGLMIFYSTPKSPASVATRELFHWGKETISDEILGMEFSYAPDAFFQNNIPMFAHAVEEMRRWVNADDVVLELYAGVGVIGMLIAQQVKNVVGIEIIPSAVVSANDNAKKLGISNYVSHCTPSEKIDEELLNGISVLVLDPPRAGLHPKLVSMIKERAPDRLVYLSCNPITQVRDIGMLADIYQPLWIGAFDFYPGTPHLESLVILKRK